MLALFIFSSTALLPGDYCPVAYDFARGGPVYRKSSSIPEEVLSLVHGSSWILGPRMMGRSFGTIKQWRKSWASEDRVEPDFPINYIRYQAILIS